ncbi:glucosidase [Cellulomonas sp. URHD0024]|uniref:MGH1-like glycoside hydrolase domain-containing protein n=1 Tax=Cellulomonas sp. URHD0024 TaxID=1302620 RepID=UPI00040E68B6|nr:glucosidase [Cellulomonas sp. URHD0024]
MGAERDRVDSFGKLEDGLLHASDWYLWGPYLSERQWGTVREDYSPDGEAWRHFPHEHARSRAYRWGEDGMAGFSDIRQRLCLSLALWNGQDPILKERMFGLTGDEGNHGEDVKEWWWFTDALPSHALNRWRYHYPQSAFPYDDLVTENRRRDKHQPEYELLDTGAFDEDRFWVVEVEYTKDGPHDVLMTIQVTNAGPDTETLHVLPTVWFRNTWSWGDDEAAPQLRAGTGSIDIDHPLFGDLELVVGPGPDGIAPTLLFCENETNAAKLFGAAESPTYPKDGINDHVLHDAPTVNPAREGTKAAAWYQVSVASQQTVELRLRLRPRGGAADAVGPSFDEVATRRRAEADEFYAELTPAGSTADEALVMRQAFAGMLWSKQLYSYEVARWLDGDPGQPVPPASRKTGRNSRWRNFDAFDIMSMPDTWEYPWFAAWDLAFHCVSLAHVDPAFAKYQLILICREWFQHPSGALPAYEWSFDDLNPPVQAWAALEVFAIDGARDLDFLRRVFDKLLVNFTWWINREDADGSNLFEGGFLGLDNIGPIDRDKLPVAGRLEQSDATAWMALYSMHMATMSFVLHRKGNQPTQDLTIKFLEHFALIKGALDDQDLWDEADGFFYDRIVLPDGERIPVKVRSMVGVLPVLASLVIDEPLIAEVAVLGKGFASLLGDALDPSNLAPDSGAVRGTTGERRILVGVVGVDRIRRLFARLFDEDEFLSTYGLRALSAAHRDHPYVLDIGELSASIDYEPAESTTAMFGGNSNWRGPIWFPLNYLLATSIKLYGTFFGDDATVEFPTGSGVHRPLTGVAEDLRTRLVSLFLVGDDGRRPCYGYVSRFVDDGQNPHWQGLVQFNEYFHGDNGAGLGAAHQTGWTGLVADLIRRRPGSGVASLSDLVHLDPAPTRPSPPPPSPVPPVR